MVWRSPHSHCGESLIRHLCIRYAHLPCDVLMRLMVAHCPRRSEKPGGSAVGSSMRCLFLTSDPAHCIRQASSGLKLDARRAFPAAQNGRRDLRRVRGGRTRSAWNGSFSLARAFLYSRSVAISHRMVGGEMFARTGSQGRVVDFRVPVTSLIAAFSWVSTRSVCEHLPQTGAQYSAVE